MMDVAPRQHDECQPTCHLSHYQGIPYIYLGTALYSVLFDVSVRIKTAGRRKNEKGGSFRSRAEWRRKLRFFVCLLFIFARLGLEIEGRSQFREFPVGLGFFV